MKTYDVHRSCSSSLMKLWDQHNTDNKEKERKRDTNNGNDDNVCNVYGVLSFRGIVLGA